MHMIYEPSRLREAYLIFVRYEIGVNLILSRGQRRSPRPPTGSFISQEWCNDFLLRFMALSSYAGNLSNTKKIYIEGVNIPFCKSTIRSRKKWIESDIVWVWYYGIRFYDYINFFCNIALDATQNIYFILKIMEDGRWKIILLL